MNTDEVAPTLAAFAILLRLISIAWHSIPRDSSTAQGKDRPND